jgi:hypothetical protein
MSFFSAMNAISAYADHDPDSVGYAIDASYRQRDALIDYLGGREDAREYTARPDVLAQLTELGSSMDMTPGQLEWALNDLR